MDDDEARRAGLRAEHGTPERFPDTGAALRLLGRRAGVHPNDAMAWVYRDQAAADAYAASNLEHGGVTSLGTCPVDGGVLGVMDFRAVLAAHAEELGQSWHFTDPALPDGWVPPRRSG